MEVDICADEIREVMDRIRITYEEGEIGSWLNVSALKICNVDKLLL
jgi:hypothetical protein